jgi:hypothetical protein
MAFGQSTFSVTTILTGARSNNFAMMSIAASSRALARVSYADSESLIARIKAEYHEMPGLSLTRPQAQRLWHLDETTCRTVLARLVASGFLRLTVKGLYTRS